MNAACSGAKAQVVRYAIDPQINARLHALVTSARLIARKQFPAAEFPGFDFDAPRWDLNRSGLAAVHKKFALFYLAPRSELSSVGGLKAESIFPSAFSDVVKAWLIHTDRSLGQITDGTQALRRLWRSLTQRRQSGTAVFTWDTFSPEDLRAGSVDLQSTAPRSIRHFEGAWRGLLKWLALNEIIADDFDWAPEAMTRHHSPEYKAERAKKIPSRRVLESLAAVYRVHATAPVDRLLICAVGLLVTCGFRISELATLPSDCIVSEKRNGRVRHGIRYWNQKTRDGAKKHAIRWLSPLGAELALALIAEIRLLTADARRQAKAIERDQGRVRIPWFGRKRLLNREEAARALSLVPGSIAPLIRNGFLQITPIVREYQVWAYSRAEIERELQRRCPPLRVVKISGGHYQTLSQTLLINFLYSTDHQATTSSLLVRTLPVSAITAFLGGSEPRTASVFSRFSLNDASEAPLRMHTHMMRHWLNTVANKAGMSAYQITLWMGRESILQTKLYLHDAAEIGDLTRELLRSHRVFGVRAVEFDSLRACESEEYLKTIRYGHQVRNGICVEDFSSHGCKSGKICDPDCRSFLAIIGDAGAIPALEQRRASYVAAVKYIDEARRSGSNVVPRQRQICRRRITKIDELIAIAKRRPTNAS